ncbi:MAG: response regulator, partial [Spirochaetaceae bacterium]
MKNILIVDDDNDLRDAIRTVLEETYGIEEAGSKQEVYDKLAIFSADLIILDVMMDTASSGFELARELKNSSKYNKTKILMLTSVDKVMNI